MAGYLASDSAIVEYDAGRSGQLSSRCAITDGHFTESPAQLIGGKGVLHRRLSLIALI
jgi:hypothetical protein